MNLNSISEYYTLNSDGKIEKVNESGTEEIFSLEEADVTYSNGTWTLSGGNIKISDNLKVEGNLNIKADSTSITGALMVSGDLVSTGELNINTGIPFNSALVVNKNIVVDTLVTIGRVHSSGDFTANGIVNIIGNAEIDGDVVLYDDTKINMLDNVYKAAMADAQEEDEKRDKTSMLVHSQLFQNLKGENSIVLFTFVEGNYLIDENTLNNLIDSGNAKDFQFKTSLYGASINYSSQLFKSDSLSDYYKNLKIVKKALNEQFGEVVIKKYIDIAPLSLYCQFEDQDGNDIGTYLVSNIANTDVSQLLKLTDEEIAQEIEALDNPTKAEEEIIQDMNDAKPEDSNETMLTLPDDVNESMKEEITSQQSLIETEINSIDKIALEGENEVARINEWVQYQELAVENEIVEVERIVANNDDLNSSAEQRGWWSKAKKKVVKGVKKVFKVVTLTDCRKKYSHNEIRGVDPRTTAMTDQWGQEVALLNDAEYCTPTAAASIMQYNVSVRRNKPSIYSNDGDNHRSSINPYVRRWVNLLKTTQSGTTPWQTYWRLGHSIYHESRNHGLFGWADSYYTTVWTRAWQFRIMQQFLRINRPGIYHAPPYTVAGQSVYHSMPIIGWRTETYSGICAKRIWPNRNWFLLDTEFNRKAYARFDGRSNYWKFGAISYIWSK